MKILFVQNRMLFPTNTGGRIRTHNILKHLAQWHDVTYLCNRLPGEEQYHAELENCGLRPESVPWNPPKPGGFGFYRDIATNLLSSEPFPITKHYNPLLHRRARELVKKNSFDLIICDFLQAANHVIDIDTCPKILFQHNVETQILERHAESRTGIAARYLKLQWRRLKRFEAEAGARFDAVIAVSENDKRKFEHDYGWRHVFAIDTAVDLDFFRASDSPASADTVLFVGSMDWIPNQDGVRYFLKEIWPHIRRARGRATFQVVGRTPPPDLAHKSGADGVEVTGTVPDVRPYYDGASVVVVPLLVGGGTRLKIFEAMAMQKAIVSTTIGAEGLPLVHGEHILLADTPADFAGAVIGLLHSAEERARLVDSSHQLVVERFGTETIARQFDEVCCRVARRAPTGTTGHPAGRIGTRVSGIDATDH
jgi:polysaccharide biosynthesis protein PslH